MENKELIVVSKYREKARQEKTSSGIALSKFYTPKSLHDLNIKDENIGTPGNYPFVRGIHENMYRGKIWTRRMLVGFGTGRYTNERLKYCIKTGASGLCVVCDTPTQLCIDSDHPMAVSEAGLVGVPFTTLMDMEDLLDGIAIDQVSISFQTPGDPGPIIFSQFIAYAQKIGVDLKALRGSTTNGPTLKLFGYETKIPIDISLKLAIDVVEYCVQNKMKFHPLIVGGYVYRENGLTPVQELGICIAAAALYIGEALKRNLLIDDVASKIAMVFSIGPDFFEEIAKIRAGRRMWAKLVKETFGAKDLRSCALSLSAHTSGLSLAAKQPMNNIVRSGYQFLSAVLGGCQAVDFSTLDEPFSTPSEFASRIALNTQNIVAYETNILSVADPLGGSYFVEALTEQVENEAWKIYEQIMEMGGLVKAFEKGWIDKLIEKEVNERQKAIESKKRIVVGVNEFQIPAAEEEKIPIHVNPRTAAAEQVKSVTKLKEKRSNSSVEKALNQLKESVESNWSQNLIPAILEAVKCYATIGEIWGSIRTARGLSYDPFEDHV